MKAKSMFWKFSIALFAMLLVFQFSVFAQTVTNGDFENWTGDNPNGWTLIPVNDYVEFSQGSDEGFTGDALKVVGMHYEQNSYEGEFYTIVEDITPSSYYRLSTKVKSNDDRIKLRYYGMKWLDADGNQVGSDINESTLNGNTLNTWVNCIPPTNYIYYL